MGRASFCKRIILRRIDGFYSTPKKQALLSTHSPKILGIFHWSVYTFISLASSFPSVTQSSWAQALSGISLFTQDSC